MTAIEGAPGWSWRRPVATVAMATSVTVLASAVWAAVRLTWFVRTSPFCAANTCTSAAAEQSFSGSSTLVADASPVLAPTTLAFAAWVLE